MIKIDAKYFRGRIYIHADKYHPVVVYFEDKFRKGVEFRICSGCGSFENTVMTTYHTSKNGKERIIHLCNGCTEKHFTKRKGE